MSKNAAPKSKDYSDLYTKEHWAANVFVYRCSFCQCDINEEDNMKLHIVTHFPPEEQDAVLQYVSKSTKE